MNTCNRAAVGYTHTVIPIMITVHEYHAALNIACCSHVSMFEIQRADTCLA